MPPEPLPPPLPIAATFTAINGAGTLVVTFDQPLQPGPTAAVNWQATTAANDTRRAVMPGVVLGDTVTIPMVAQIHPPDVPGTHNFLATPPDLLGLTGLPVAAYANFPTVFI